PSAEWQTSRIKCSPNMGSRPKTSSSIFPTRRTCASSKLLSRNLDLMSARSPSTLTDTPTRRPGLSRFVYLKLLNHKEFAKRTWFFWRALALDSPGEVCCFGGKTSCSRKRCIFLSQSPVYSNVSELNEAALRYCKGLSYRPWRKRNHYLARL